MQVDIKKTLAFMNTAEKYDGSFDKLYGQLNTLQNYKSIINDLPTAYDVEKVVAELENAKFLMPPENDNHYADNGLFLEDAIDIVRKGGV